MVSSTAVKYARALAEVAREVQRVDQIGQEIAAFQGLMESHRELAERLLNPAMSSAVKRRIVEELAARVPLSAIVVNFLLVLIDSVGLSLLDRIVEAYETVLDEQRGIVRGEVHSARELDESTRMRLRQAMQAKIGKVVTLRYRLDPSLIAGLKVQVGATVYDGSIRARLDEILRRVTGD
jgi:F-type H+-transporting ATPase subunit delta